MYGSVRSRWPSYAEMGKDTKSCGANRFGFELPKAETLKSFRVFQTLSRNGGHHKHLKNQQEVGSPG
jgi:hypothetical protein